MSKFKKHVVVTLALTAVLGAMTTVNVQTAQASDFAVDSFFDVFYEEQLNQGNILYRSDSRDTGTFQTEMVSLSLQSSPTGPDPDDNPGAVLRDLGGGHWQVDSRLDNFSFTWTA